MAHMLIKVMHKIIYLLAIFDLWNKDEGFFW